MVRVDSVDELANFIFRGDAGGGCSDCRVKSTPHSHRSILERFVTEGRGERDLNDLGVH